jgi:putative tryptophan/tyrosine transport system substrate-binding protein
MWIRITLLVSAVVLGLLVVGSVPAQTQQTGKVYRIGFLGQGPPSFYTVRFNAFRQELRARGYLEGRDVQYEYRYAGGKLDRLPGLASELLRLKVDVIVTTSTPSTRAAMTATRIIPIVMNAGTPVESGLVASLARPGGNVTGVTLLSGRSFTASGWSCCARSTVRSRAWPSFSTGTTLRTAYR